MQATFCQACVINPCSIPEWCSKWQEVGENGKGGQGGIREFMTERAPWDWGGSVSNTSSSPPSLPSSLLLSHLWTDLHYGVCQFLYIYTTGKNHQGQVWCPASTPPTPPGGWHGEEVFCTICRSIRTFSSTLLFISHVRYSQQRLSMSSSTVDCIVWMSPLAIVVLDVYQSQKVRESPPGHRDKQ